MRQRRAGATAGTIHPRFAVSRRIATRAAAVLIAAWMAWAFADEAWTASRLSNQAADLRHRNAVLQSQNEQYQRDIATVESGAAAEEVARQNGYARPGERIYVVGSPPPAPGSTGAGGVSSPAPPASPPARVTVGTAASGGPLDGLGRWWSALWTRR